MANLTQLNREQAGEEWDDIPADALLTVQSKSRGTGKIPKSLLTSSADFSGVTAAITAQDTRLGTVEASDTAQAARINVVELGQISSAIGYATKTAMDADLAHAAGSIALVTNDATEANNTTYRKTGASGTGSWTVATDRVTLLEARRNAIAADTSGYELSGYVQATLDAAGKVVQGFRADGSYELLNRTPLAELDLINPVVATQPAGYGLSGYSYVIADQLDRLAFGIAPDGTVTIPKLTLLNSLDPAAVVTIMRDQAVLPSASIVWWGDSLTANLDQSAVNDTFLTRPVIRHGFGGQTSTLIAARNGGRPILLTLTGNTLPASGSVVITAKSPSPFLSTATAGDSVTGRILNVPVTITQDVTFATYTLTRLVAGAAKYANPNSLFVPDNAESKYIHVLWLGRNNYTSPTDVLADTQYCVNRIGVGTKRFVVLSVLNGEYTNERSGGGGYDLIMQCNVLLQQTYPDNYLDVRRLIVEGYNSGSSPDVVCYGYDQTPPSLRNTSDNIHLNTAGSLIVLQAVKSFIDAKGW